MPKKKKRRIKCRYCQTYRDVLLKVAWCGPCDGGGLCRCSCGGGGGDQGAGLTRLRRLWADRLLGLGLCLDVCQRQTSRRRDGTLHLHWRVPRLLTILDILHAQNIEICTVNSLLWILIRKWSLQKCGKWQTSSVVFFGITLCWFENL